MGHLVSLTRSFTTLGLTALVLGGTALVPAEPVCAQTATIVFGSTEARTCYQEARFGTAIRDGISACNRALDEADLSRADRVATLVNRGILYNRSRQFASAIADFDLALRQDPDSGEAYLNRGNSKFFQSQFDAALADYDDAIRLGTREPHAAYFNRGLVKEAQGFKREALDDYRQALTLKPDFSQAQGRAALLERQVEE